MLPHEIEEDAIGETPEQRVQCSIAISLKRIADALTGVDDNSIAHAVWLIADSPLS